MKTLILILLLTTCLYSTIINIPVDQPTIQEGINVAVDADTVLVQPGTYVENINYYGKNITVASLFLTTQDTTYIYQTIIDGNQSGSVVTFENGETQTAILIGFTITNGYSSTSGGGISCIYTYPRLENLIIIGNYAAYNGGGIICGAYANPSFENVIITNNSSGFAGGGIYCYNYCSPSLKNVLISDNTSQYGGGICCLENSSPNLGNVTITDNSAAGGGGGIFCDNSNPIVINSIFRNDFPEEIHINSGSVTVTYSDIQGGWAGEGNIDADPIFEDPLISDYHLQDTSPCIGAGIDSIEISGVWYYAPSYDFDGNPRPYPVGSMPDMGAYESLLAIPVGVVDDLLIIPEVYSLAQNYPNPFNPATKIRYSIPQSSQVQIKVFDMLGNEIETLVNEEKPVGSYEVGFDATGLPSGTYFYRLQAGNFVETKKMTLIK